MTDEIILEEMLERATNPLRDTVDELGVQMFCMVARNNVQKAQEMIISKIRSKNVTESTRTIELLEECMTKCGSEFQDEVAKFRFLNDLIRLVSTKFQGAETPQPIKQRIMECLLLWTTEFPQKIKIREAYDSLNKEGGVEHGNTPAVVAKKESILGIDEEVLSKLIKSNDPENFKRANLLIQYRVNQEVRRTEFRLQLKSKLLEVQNTVNLLSQMLDNYETAKDQKPEEGSETMNLIRELYMSCKRHKPMLQRMLEMHEQVAEELTVDTCETIDLLVAVMKRYKSSVVHSNSKEHTTPTNHSKQVSAAPISVNTDTLLAELLGDVIIPVEETADAPKAIVNDAFCTSTAKESSINRHTTQAASKTLRELQDIFSNLEKSERDPEVTETMENNELFDSCSLLEPVNVHTSDNKNTEKAGNIEVDDQLQPMKRAFRELREIDKLSEELFKQSLPYAERVSSFKKDIEKITLNDLVKENTNLITTPTKTSKLDKVIGEQEELAENNTVPDDELMLGGADAVASNNNPNINISATNKTVSEHIKKEREATPLNNCAAISVQLPTKHLSEISIDLDEVTPTAEERLLLDDDDVKITLNLTESRPSRQVSVIVISVLNKSKMPIKDFQFEASVKKPCKVRLLPSTDTEMSPYKPFRPPIPINQVMLLLNPTHQAVDVNCIVGYKLGADPDPIKELLMAKNIPYVE